MSSAWHVDDAGDTWRPLKAFTCPNHPDGPPTLPADGYEREELTLEEAYTAEEIEALRAVVAGARDRGEPEAEHVERMFGLCCAGHTWETIGYRRLSPADVTVSKVGEILLDMARTWQPSPAILLAELGRDRPAGEPIRIPIILEAGTEVPRSDAARAAGEAE